MSRVSVYCENDVGDVAFFRVRFSVSIHVDFTKVSVAFAFHASKFPILPAQRPFTKEEVRHSYLILLIVSCNCTSLFRGVVEDRFRVCNPHLSSCRTFTIVIQGAIFGNSVATRLFTAFPRRAANRARRKETAFDHVTAPTAGKKRDSG